MQKRKLQQITPEEPVFTSALELLKQSQSQLEDPIQEQTQDEFISDSQETIPWSPSEPIEIIPQTLESDFENFLHLRFNSTIDSPSICSTHFLYTAPSHLAEKYYLDPIGMNKKLKQILLDFPYREFGPETTIERLPTQKLTSVHLAVEYTPTK